MSEVAADLMASFHRSSPSKATPLHIGQAADSEIQVQNGIKLHSGLHWTQCILRYEGLPVEHWGDSPRAECYGRIEILESFLQSSLTGARVPTIA